MKKIILLSVIICLLSSFLAISAPAAERELITDWYLKEFHSDITVNPDSTLDIVEKIIADCGNLPDQHGIFRTLPTAMFLSNGKKIKTPVDIISVTDFSGNPLSYQKVVDPVNNALTLKIGDPNKTVSGENDYLIKYRYKNIIRFESDSFAELYWNLNGNFWNIETDKYTANILLPTPINRQNTEVNLYSGQFGAPDSGLASYRWITGDNSIFVEARQTLKSGEGITISIVFPKGIIEPYQFTGWEKYGSFFNWFTFVLPIITFIITYRYWQKNGRNHRLNKTIIAEYQPPDNLPPLQIDLLLKSGRLTPPAITATIINLAIKGYLRIEELNKKEYSINLIKDNLTELTTDERVVIEAIFDKPYAGERKTTKDLKKNFYKKIPTILEKTVTQLTTEQFFDPLGFKYQKIFIFLSFFAGLAGIDTLLITFKRAA